ncbi:uncharacterized protein CDAR_311831, partial [Caerostris darwini]
TIYCEHLGNRDKKDAPCHVYEDEDQILPSQVTDREYIFVPRTYECIDENDEDVVKRGKWMIFTKGDINKLDEYWLALLPLYRRGILAGLKCSTVKSTGPGVINCYTVDSENRLEVKIAADAIRDCIEYRKMIFYKTNQASLQGLYHHNENRNISKYMHTVHKDLFEKDEIMRWKLLSF